MVESSTADAEARAVAVIGMACRFPGASGPDQLWDVLRQGVDTTSETPPERYDVDGLYTDSPRPGPGKIASRRAGYLSDIAGFDAEFFGMSPAEAAGLDPQQRLLLMTAWEALEDAGLRPEELAGSRTGVYVGNNRADFVEMQFRQGLEAVTPSIYHNFRSMLPARLSHFFDFRGPSMIVDTACSSSLVAVHNAAMSLRAGESPLAVVAGVNIMLRPDEGVMMTQAGTIALDGRSKFGDASADGFAPSDGIGVVILKPLAKARADGDRVRAVIQGSAVSNDGQSGDALLTPSVAGQVDLLRWAYEDAGVAPSEVDFVEAHGSGSPALDQAELNAIGRVLGEGRPADRPCLVGSVKSNIGYAEAAGGMAGLIKTVLSLEHGEVPPSLHLDTPSALVAWDELPLVVPSKPERIPDRGRPAVAGVTGQGVSCLNAHLVVRQGDTRAVSASPAAPPAPSPQPCVLPLSARSPQALTALAHAYAAYLGPDGQGTAHPLRDICYSAATRRQHHEHRTAVVASSHEAMVAALTVLREPGEPTTLAEAVAERYRDGHVVNWEAFFGPGCRFVPLPTYPWQTKRYWLGDHQEEDADLATAVLRAHVRDGQEEYADSALLSELGIDSLARLQIILRLAREHGYEVEAEELGELRTVGEFRQWLSLQEAQAA
ncbi:beta-ketoacyl synthase N-terminal-like domain-containing protein [Streptomyces sp. 4N509B]|uniref:beta-ketoacyl synthase N-terminal-like domain-containing protein n=1 Tax=Streptomyces sp. 4N509B TaxID=3457413 RepID=UPI003FD299B1